MAWKIVYYGAGLCGKTTNFVALRNALPESKLLSFSSQTDRQLELEMSIPLEEGSRQSVELHTEPG